MPTLQTLPIDVSTYICSLLNPSSQLQLSLTCKSLAYIALESLWRFPVCNSYATLASIIQTLYSAPLYHYSEWIEELEIRSLSEPTNYARLSLPTSRPQIMPKAINFSRIDRVSDHTNDLLKTLIHVQLTHIQLNQCSHAFLDCLTAHLSQQKYDALTHLSFSQCVLFDTHVQRIVQHTPRLRYLRCHQSGYLSDRGIMSIATSCPEIETLIVTLPPHLSQANTITFAALEALCQCRSLSTFVCQGQVRIASSKTVEWLLNQCPSLKHFDLSI